ncbi:MAG: hypothetical protein JO302_03840, partial [Candidatus Eremiobacteraeota bacterium]|nr:hypothetical protein [Candidatus Eremiobacteraeota bacterium]
RLDFFIAIAALLVSALTAGTLIYQTRVIGAQYAAAIWPYLSVETTYDNPNGLTIALNNDGLGPALIHSAQLSVESKDVSSWYDYFIVLAREDSRLRGFFMRMRAAALTGHLPPVTITTASVASTAIRPGQSKVILKVWSPVPDLVPLEAVTEHPIAIDLCYCSLNGNCWSLHATPGKNGAPSRNRFPDAAATRQSCQTACPRPCEG